MLTTKRVVEHVLHVGDAGTQIRAELRDDRVENGGPDRRNTRIGDACARRLIGSMETSGSARRDGL
jgi:hypothetical protein